MNRIIKFRAYDNQAKCMSNTFNPLLNEIPEIAGCPINYSQSEFMQFTGLYDKYGVEIFEGDLISFEDDPTSVVKYSEEFCCYVGWDSDEYPIINECDCFDWYQIKKQDQNHLIVRGNIFEGLKSIT